jgi:hypothetical protein
MVDIDNYKIIKYSYKLSNEELIMELWEKMTFEDTQWSVKLTLEGICDTSEEGTPQSWDIILVEPKLEEKVEKILHKYDIEYLKEDITELLITNTNSFTSNFLGKLNGYLDDSLTVNGILDNINEIGIDNISVFERHYLNQIK